ncbi:MFS transporter [Neorhizobium sp. P12A]|uniref:MFS transporter n=1 Tax=Neorhizobium sp. P12A TaxID=2268027 RepID=UPI0011EE855B|nr:MFS transporter [Neorhizobium sp. P12A]KAA0691949.1 MFS transporter [Neorhizobium sp. P12A]
MDAAPPPDTSTIERQTMRKVTWRLVPILMLGYFCASLDRANIGMAATTMSPELNFSNAEFGFGAGIFFFGYLLAEIPSNLVLDRFGARVWLTRILVTWGIVSALTAFVWNGWSFYTVRFFLGLAEAGFFPGVLIYITWWFPARYRSRVVAWFMSAGVISQILGPPIGGLLMHLDGYLGLAGWQWLFVVEAVPSIVTGALILWQLTDRPGQARWLDKKSQDWLEARLATERAQQESVQTFTLKAAFSNTKVWLLTFVELGHQYAGYGLVFFMPLIVKGLGVSKDWIGPVAAIPYIFGFVAMILWGYSSDRSGERVWHASSTMFIVAAAMLICKFVGGDHPVILMIVLTIAVIGNQSFAPCFWSIPGTMLTGTAAAGGIAMINAVGNLGGWIGPSVYGAVRDASGSTSVALLALAAGPLLGGIVLLLVGHDKRLERIAPSS